MPLLNRPFKDSSASVGVPKDTGPEIDVQGKLSRSYDKNIEPKDKTFSIHFRKDGYFHFDFSKVVGSKIKINKTIAKRIANFILSETNNDKADLARKSEKRIRNPR